MLTAFARYADGSCEGLDSMQAVAEAWARQPAGLWVDLEEPGEDEVASVGQVFKLDAEALEDCLHGQQRPRLDEFDDHVFLVAYAVPEIDHPHEFELRKLAAFCGPRFLITVHRESVPTIAVIREHCARHSPHWLGRGVDFVLYSIIDGMVDYYLELAEACESRLDVLDDQSLTPDADESILGEISALRWQLVELRRVASSQRELVLPIARGEYDFVSEALAARFRHVVDHLTKVVEMIDGLRELLNGVRDNYHSVIANRMNAVMKTLTIFATIILPLGVIAGVYGMNVPLWPPADEPMSFWVILGAMLAVVCTMLVFFRRRKWI